MVLPMMLADRRKAFRLGAWVAFWSVAGGMFGYAIGALFWETAGLWLINLLHVPLAQVEALRAKYTAHAYLIMVQGATPIPYKLVTIASGLAGVSFPLFMFYSAVTRSIRYVVIEAALVTIFGEKAQTLLEKYLELALVLFFVALVLGFVVLRYL
jgi:membrane protein YqaA with SNARE-associated domain